MPPESVLEDSDRICGCGYKTRKKDAFWNSDYEVWLIRCYSCGYEWVV